MPRKNLLQLRRGNFSDWSVSNPILASGEPGIDIESNILKIGDGVNAWNDLHQIGGENLYYVKNDAGSIIRAGQCVYAKGAVGNSNSIKVGLFIANGTIPEYTVMGLSKSDIGIGEFGYISAFGTISQIDTYPNGNITNLADSGEYWDEGTILYASPNVAGKLTQYKPQHDTILAIVLKRNNNGKLFVRPSWNPHLDDLHDVYSVNPSHGQFLQYNATSGFWLPSNTGNFTFLSVNNIPVSLSGHQHSISDISGLQNLISSNIVYTSGNQTISGIKTFKNEIVFNSGISISASSTNTVGWIPVFDGPNTPSDYTQSLLYIDRDNFKNDLNIVDFSNFSGLLPLISGTGFVQTILENNTYKIGVTGLQLTGNYVSLTGNENISGTKTFLDNIIVTGQFLSTTGYFNNIYINNTGEGDALYVINNAYIGGTLSAAALNFGAINASGNLIIEGSGNFLGGLYSSGVQVSVTGHRHPFYEIDNFCSGVAECVDTPLLAGTGIILSYIDGTGLFIHFSGLSSSSYVTVTGDQVISGVKTFQQSIIATGGMSSVSGYFRDYLSLNGTGVSLTGHTHEIYQITNLQNELNNKQPTGNYISVTGIESIDGQKTFTNNIISTGILFATTGYFNNLYINNTGGGDALYVINNAYIGGTLSASSLNFGAINASGNIIIEGSGNFLGGLYSSGVRVSVTGHRHPFYEIDNFCSGVAECVDTPLLAGTGILLSFVSGTGLFIHVTGSSNIGNITGFVVQTGSNSYIGRSLNEGRNISISFKDGIQQNPIIATTNNITGLTGLQITGYNSALIFNENSNYINLKLENNNTLSFNSSSNTGVLIINSSGIISPYAEISIIESSIINGGFF